MILQAVDIHQSPTACLALKGRPALALALFPIPNLRDAAPPHRDRLPLFLRFIHMYNLQPCTLCCRFADGSKAWLGRAAEPTLEPLRSVRCLPAVTLIGVRHFGMRLTCRLCLSDVVQRTSLRQADGSALDYEDGTTLIDGRVAVSS